MCNNNNNNNTGSSLGEKNQISRDACSYIIIYYIIMLYTYRNAADVSRVYIIIYIEPCVCPSADEQ